MNAVANANAASLPDVGVTVDEPTAVEMTISNLPASPAPQTTTFLPSPPQQPILWRPGIEEDSALKRDNGVPRIDEQEPDDDEEDDEEEDEFDEEEQGFGQDANQMNEDSCGSPGLSPNKSGLSNRKGSREQTKIQPLRLESGHEAFRCPICFPDGHPGPCNPITGRKALTEHLRWHQNQEQQQEGRFACCYCSKELSSYSSLDRHLLTHTNFRPFICTHCNRDFTTNGNLNRHVKTSHQGIRNGSITGLSEDVTNPAVRTPSSMEKPASVLPSSAVSSAKNSPRPVLGNVHQPPKPASTVSSLTSKPSLGTSSASPFQHQTGFPLGAAQTMSPLADSTPPLAFVPTCLPMSLPAAASALLPTNSMTGLSSFDPTHFSPPYSHWFMLMRQYSSGTHPSLMPFAQMGSSFLSHPGPGLIPPGLGTASVDTLEALAEATGRPMPVLTPQNPATQPTADLPSLTVEEIHSNSHSPSASLRIASSPGNSAQSPAPNGNVNGRPRNVAGRPAVKRLRNDGAGVTRLRQADGKKLIYKAGLQHWGRVLRGRAIDFLNRRTKKTDVNETPVKETKPTVHSSPMEEPCLPLDLSMKTAPVMDACSPVRDSGDAHTVMPSLPPPQTPSFAAEESVLDLSVRSSSLSDGASPPANERRLGTCPVSMGLQDSFIPPLLSSNHVTLFHMHRDEAIPTLQSLQLLESNNNYDCDNMTNTPLSFVDPKKKIDETAKLFTGRYAKRRPQKKTQLAPPTINPCLKISTTSRPPTQEAIQVEMNTEVNIVDHVITSPDSTQLVDRKNSLARKKNSYKDAPNRMLCPIEGCEQQFPWKSSLKRHVITHYDFKPYKCVTCNRQFSTKSNRERHIERLHGLKSKRSGRVPRMPSERTEPVETFQMPLGSAEIESMNFSDLKADRMSEEILEKAGHIVTAPNPERIGSSSYSATRRHPVQDTSPGGLPKVNGLDLDVHSPQSSAEVTGGAQNMQIHVQSHQSPSSLALDGSAFKCPVCAREFGLQDSALDHMQSAHPSEWAMTASKLTVDKLIRGLPANGACWSDGVASGGEEPDAASKRVLCPVCRRKFASFQDLQRHARSHTGERPFICPLCHREFALKHSLNRHMRTHDPAALPVSGGEEM